jgi:hypothetical protein
MKLKPHKPYRPTKSDWKWAKSQVLKAVPNPIVKSPEQN